MGLGLSKSTGAIGSVRILGIAHVTDKVRIEIASL